jgi:hypothetical protein
MNLTIKYDFSAAKYCGEFVEPNIIKIYVNQCINVKRSIENVIAHERVHYIIYNINILHYLINKLNTHSIKKCRNKGIINPDEVYKYLIEENICDFIANIITKRHYK